MGETRPGPIDWYGIDRSLIKNYPSLTPQSIDRLTMSEIALMLDPDNDRPHGGRGWVMDDMEADESWHRWRAMSGKEKLEYGRKMRGF